MNIIKVNKFVAVIAIITLALTQVAPAGWAAPATPVDEVQGGAMPAQATRSAEPEQAPQPQAPVPAPQTSTDFLTNQSPLSPAVSKEDGYEIMPKPETPTLTPTFVRAVVPVNVVVTTDPATGKELSVAVDDRGIATVKWGDEEYKGVFDPKTNSVLLVTKDDAIWTLQFEKNDKGELYLQTFQTQNWTKEGHFYEVNPRGYQGYSSETYTYDPQGNLIRKDWSNNSYRISCGFVGCYENSQAAGGTIDYVQINGKTLVSHEKTWSDNQYPFYKLETKEEYIGTFRYPYGHSESETWHSYDGQGNLLAKNWNTSDGFGNTSYGQEQYVHINGRDRISVRRVWQYNQFRKYILPIQDYPYERLYNQENVAVRYMEFADSLIALPLFTSYHSETYYNYDSDGNMIAEVTAWDGYKQDGTHETGGSYWLFDTAKNAWANAAASGFNNMQVRSWQDYGIIEAAAQQKTVYAGSSAQDRTYYNFYVEYIRGADGVMSPKAVYDGKTNVWIVQGEPDVLSGESDDIKLQNGQYVDIYKDNVRYTTQIFYQIYPELDANGNKVRDVYRLLLTNPYGTTFEIAAALDFPKQDTVTLGGVEYKITILDGKLILNPVSTIPPAVQEYVDALQKELGEGYKVSVTLLRGTCKDGSCPQSYQITVTDLADVVLAGRFQSMSFTISEDGTFTRLSSVTYQRIGTVDHELLYESLQMMKQVLPLDKNIRSPEPPSFPTDPTLVTMTKINVTSVDENGAIHFTKDGVSYKCYRDAEGKVVLEKELPPAVQAYVDFLKQQLGSGYDVYAQLWYGEVIAIYPPPPAPFLGYELFVNVNGKAGPGQLTYMRVLFDPDGTFETVGAAFFEEVYPVDARLLFEGLQQILTNQNLGIEVLRTNENIRMNPSQDVLAAMTRAVVTRVDESGAIHFQYKEVSYVALRSTVKRGEVLVGTEASAEDIAEAKEILGGEVVSGIVPLRFRRMVGGQSVVYFFDSKGNLAGRKETPVGVAPQHEITSWFNKDGKLIQEVRPDGSKTVYAYGDGYRVVTSYDAQGIATKNVIEIENGPRVDITNLSIQYLSPYRYKALLRDGFLPRIVEAAKDLASRLGEGAAGMTFEASDLGVVTNFPEGRDWPYPDFLLVMTYYLTLKIGDVSFKYTAEDTEGGIGGRMTTGQMTLDLPMAEIFERPEVKELTTAQAKLDAIKKILAKQLPPAVQALVDQLKQQLADNYEVTAELLENGTYLVTVSDARRYFVKPTHGLASLSFFVSASGQINPDSKGNWFKGGFWSGPSVDLKLLFEGLKLLKTDSSDADAIVLMTLIKVTNVDESGAIYFTKDGVSYKCYRDADGKAILAKGPFSIPGFPTDPHLAVHIDDVAAHFGISVTDIVKINKYEAGAVCLGTGCASWAIQVEMIAMVHGEETLLEGIVNGPPWDTIVYPIARTRKAPGGTFESLFRAKPSFAPLSQSGSAPIEDAVELIKKQNAKKQLEEISKR